jgi:oxaloacetate decarboxylase gamma subunit
MLFDYYLHLKGVPMEVNLVTEGLKFMVLGMTTVFLFLVLLIYVLKLQAKLIGKYFPEKEIKPPTPIVPAVSTTTSNDEDSKVIAAITAAITDFKKR